jgi:2-polyprenyl-3-methyl-5-hydroxy-6-metoxy-1,4-benzoquinol methylase
MAAPALAVPNCPACASSATKDLMVYGGHQLRICNHCEFVFTAQRNFATSPYEDTPSGKAAYQSRIKAAERTHRGELGFRDLWWFQRKALKWLHTRLGTGRLLDIGSGPGAMLMVARQLYGFDVQGVEPVAIAVESAIKFGVPTFYGTLQDYAKEKPGKFDAISSFEVLEHVADPVEFLQTANQLLKPNAILILSMPNLDDPYCLQQQIAPTMPPPHINFFSRRSLKVLLDRAGFSIMRAYTLPIPTSSVRNVYGKEGFLIRIPYLFARRFAGKADGTTLLIMATPK